MIGEALRLLRVFNNLKAKDLADKLGISPNYLSEIEKGKKNPSFEIIKKYGEIFSVKPSALMFFSEELSSQAVGDNTRKWIAGKLLTFLQVVENGKNC